ncbi:MAG: isoprenylcysteine carboxylmethyltransferase family protein [Synergistales bacterium]|nr:isoprenylcysteine carboxylmethyltransferase family protein [Synergistales bacterium]
MHGGGRESLGRKAFKLRGGVWTLCFLLLLVLARPTVISLLAGLPLVCAGQGLRFWAAAVIGVYRGEELKAPQLVTWGPYALVRNPLYLGNGLIGLGWAVMSATMIGMVCFALVFLVLYGLLIIPEEERFLGRRFGEVYHAYAAETPALIPSFRRFGTALQGAVVQGVLWTSERHSLYVTVLGTLLFVARWGVWS